MVNAGMLVEEGRESNKGVGWLNAIQLIRFKEEEKCIFFAGMHKVQGQFCARMMTTRLRDSTVSHVLSYSDAVSTSCNM